MAPDRPASDRPPGAFASASVARHLARGAIGFGLIGSAFALTLSVGPAALLLAPPGLAALRGCPTCWIAGLIQTISAGRLERTCTEGTCTLRPTTLHHTPTLHPTTLHHATSPHPTSTPARLSASKNLSGAPDMAAGQGPSRFPRS